MKILHVLAPNRLHQQLACVVVLAVGALFAIPYLPSLIHATKIRLIGQVTLEERILEIGPQVRQRLQPHFERANLRYPPQALLLAVFKAERKLELYAGPSKSDLRFIREYSILGASGTLGPKLREGDRQVPEGLYRVEHLNPNSRFHVSIKLDYPNEFDRQLAASENRKQLGGDIFIHGGSASIGCLAMGDSVAEELFILAAEAGLENIEVVISPVDLRVTELPEALRTCSHAAVYDQLTSRLAEMTRSDS